MIPAEVNLPTARRFFDEESKFTKSNLADYVKRKGGRPWRCLSCHTFRKHLLQWRQKYGGMEVSEAIPCANGKRCRLKRLCDVTRSVRMKKCFAKSGRLALAAWLSIESCIQ